MVWGQASPSWSVGTLHTPKHSHTTSICGGAGLEAGESSALSPGGPPSFRVTLAKCGAPSLLACLPLPPAQERVEFLPKAALISETRSMLLPPVSLRERQWLQVSGVWGQDSMGTGGLLDRKYTFCQQCLGTETLTCHPSGLSVENSGSQGPFHIRKQLCDFKQPHNASCVLQETCPDCPPLGGEGLGYQPKTEPGLNPR